MYTLAEALVYNYNNHLGIIDDGQLDDECFKSWCVASIGMCKKVKIIKKDRNYMWSNIARDPKYMDLFVRYKEQIVPNIQKKVELDQATEFERKIQYGILLDRQTLI